MPHMSLNLFKERMLAIAIRNEQLRRKVSYRRRYIVIRILTEKRYLGGILLFRQVASKERRSRGDTDKASRRGIYISRSSSSPPSKGQAGPLAVAAA